jgi:hypothetical protein
MTAIFELIKEPHEFAFQLYTHVFLVAHYGTTHVAMQEPVPTGYPARATLWATPAQSVCVEVYRRAMWNGWPIPVAPRSVTARKLRVASSISAQNWVSISISLLCHVKDRKHIHGVLLFDLI